MRVAIVSHYWKNSQGGGVKNYVVNLFDGLKSEGVEVTVVFKEGTDEENIKVEGSRFIFPLEASLEIIRKIRPDVIHTHGTWYCLLAGVIGKIFLNARLVHTFHTEPTEKERLSFLPRCFMQFLLNQVDCVTFVSNALKRKIEEVYGLRFVETVITPVGVKFVEMGYAETRIVYRK